jgi:hypothetical protein
MPGKGPRGGASTHSAGAARHTGSVSRVKERVESRRDTKEKEPSEMIARYRYIRAIDGDLLMAAPSPGRRHTRPF